MTPTIWAAPIFRWAGSKRQILHRILEKCPPKYNTYYEPFLGSGCLYFALNPERAILSDINAELISTYRMIQTHPRLLVRKARAIDEGIDYYTVRDKLECRNDLDKAARFLYLNSHCFNGIYRTNQSGKFNVPKGTRTSGIPSEAKIYRASIALRKANIIQSDFEEVCSTVTAGDFVYLDPPYDYTNRKDRGEYGVNKFRLNDIERLSKLLERIHSARAIFLCSYLDTKEIQHLKECWNFCEIPVKRQVSAYAISRKLVHEIVVSNINIS